VGSSFCFTFKDKIRASASFSLVDAPDTSGARLFDLHGELESERQNGNPGLAAFRGMNSLDINSECAYIHL
jgi:hypothetical protein